MKLRTFDGERVRNEMTTDFPVSQDGIPILLADGEPFSPEEAEFFLESATPKEMEKLLPSSFFIESGQHLSPLLSPTLLAGILISAQIAGLHTLRVLCFDRTSFPIPGRVKDPAFLVSEIASAEGFDRNQEDGRRSAKKALEP